MLRSVGPLSDAGDVQPTSFRVAQAGCRLLARRPAVDAPVAGPASAGQGGGVPRARTFYVRLHASRGEPLGAELTALGR
jgi:hypothetical protein